MQTAQEVKAACQIEGLECQVSALERKLRLKQAELEEANRLLEEALEARDADKKDAERYRYLRGCGQRYMVTYMDETQSLIDVWGGKLDTLIDEARQP